MTEYKPKYTSYNGNPNVKRDGVEQAYTQEQLEEYKRCAQSASYFAENYCQVVHIDKGLVPFKLYPYQRKMFDEFQRNRFNIVLACRQSGKSISSVAYILWFSLFRPDETIAILANKGDTAKEMLYRITTMLENVPFFLQPGTKTLNKTSIEFSNNSRIYAGATSGSSIRGKSCVTGDTRICIENENGSIHYVDMEKLENKEKFNIVTNGSKYHIVYQITNTVNGKYYVGYHKTDDFDDGYMGSGKLIKRAIEKYGIEVFEKEIIAVFDNQKEAEALEAEIVNRDFTLDDNTYNIAEGGNVRILHGKNNGFYNKTHTAESRELISKNNLGKRVKSDNTGIANGVECYNYTEFSNALGLENRSKHQVIHACGDPNQPDVYFYDDYIQSAAVKYYNRCVERDIENRRKLSATASKTFKGVPKTAEHAAKISAALAGVPRENKHNKDPEKIRKTAEKHRGMKRSDAAKQNMSAAKKGKPAKNQGKKYYRNPETNQGNYFIKGTQPTGWIQGTGSRKKT